MNKKQILLIIVIFLIENDYNRFSIPQVIFFIPNKYKGAIIWKVVHNGNHV